MMFEIKWIEKKTSSKGTEYHKATLTLDGETFEDVAIFGGFEEKDLFPGGKVEGELQKKEYMGKPSYTLNAPNKPKAAPGGGFKQKMIEETMERKEKAITRFQSDKELSIKVSSTFRAAVDTAIAEFGTLKKTEQSSETFATLYEKWREFYWFAFDATDGNGNPKYPPFK